MTPEEVWREARKASAARYAECYRESRSASWPDEADQAAVSVISTAMEAYAAEKVAEERAMIVEWLGFSFEPDGMGGRDLLDCIARDIAANQHHGGNDADT